MLLVGNTKGGVGKTTLALNLAIARALAGREVWLVDGDSQGSSSKAIQIRAEAGRLPGIACSEFDKGPVLRTQLLAQRSKYQDIIIDAGGRDSSALRAALVLADAVIVPFQPRSLDVWALDEISALVDEARSTRDGLAAYALLSMADPSGADNREAAAAAREFPQFEFLPQPITRRKAFAEGAGRGMSVLELEPRNDKAIAEMQALVDAVFK